MNYAHRQDEVQAALSHLNFFNSSGAADAFNRIQWTPENITDFQEGIQTAEIVNGYCWYDQAHPVSVNIIHDWYDVIDILLLYVCRMEVHLLSST